MPVSVLWWQWLLFGLLLMVAELVSPGGFYMIFFGVGAVVVGLLVGLGVGGGTTAQFGAFAALSVVSLVVFRSRLLKWFQADPQQPAVDQLVGEIGVTDEALSPGQVGRVELRGTAWSARNVTALPLARGVRVRVRRVDGLTLDVEPEGVH